MLMTDPVQPVLFYKQPCDNFSKTFGPLSLLKIKNYFEIVSLVDKVFQYEVGGFRK